MDGGPEEFQFNPDVAAVDDGRFLVVWRRWVIGTDIYGQLVDSTGEHAGPQLRVNQRTAFWQVYPAVAADALGGAFVVWAWNDDVGDQGPFPQNVGGRRFLPDGTPAGAEIQVNRRAANPVSSRHEPTVAVATSPGGESLVVWSSEQGRIVARPYDHQGLARPEANVDPADGRVNATPAVAADADGNFVVLWASQETRQRPAEIMARGFKDGRPVGPVRALGVAPLRYGIFPAVTSDSAGRFVAAWTEVDARHSRGRVVLRQLSPEGGPKGAIRIVSRGGLPDVAAGPDGDVLVVWLGPSPNPGAARIFGKRFRAR